MIATRLLRELDDVAAASAVVTEVWGDPALATTSLLRAYSHFGNPVVGAYDGTALCGVAIGFLAAEPDLHLHSHITCVVPSLQHSGIGVALKHAQRDWCRANDIASITWTFDPMQVRNAYFNLHKLGAVVREVLPNFYGSMDDDINRGQRTDRLVAWWPVEDEVARGEIEHTIAVHDREQVVRELGAAFADGLVATDFDREKGYCLSR